MKQTQRSGDNSTNYQAEVINTGISYRDAKDIATDVYRENIPKFTEIAREAALDRAMEFTDKLLGSIPQESLEALKDPDVQRALFFAQQEFACSGEEDLGDVLITLLVDRLASPQRDIRRLALNEALKTAPKLAANHFSALSALFLLTRTRLAVNSVAGLHEKLRSVLAPVVYDFKLSDADLAYLQYTGCLSIQITENSIGGIFLSAYQGIFTRGFTLEQVPDHLREGAAPILIPCIRDPSKLQLDAVSKEAVKDRLESHGLGELGAEISNLMDVGIMSAEEIEEEFSAVHPALRELSRIYHSTPMKSCQLTTVGTTLAHSNIRRVIGDAFDAGLEIWVN
ncbi:LPO_1073/Vpar_1526 family protein [Streptomyces reticuli]|uniref:LPO_1073/Vpar_1526 family protein n=1 Tax=Streptomyces reticuli TaxID=1926 RepID=UPI00073DDC93|nr:hypothetical protein [Streptomyces sp. SID7810]CUW30940.1 hypothetical protein TUE45_05675 [Streptomyces reticuli]